MAITTVKARMQQLAGKYAELNTDNMLIGELAVPNDHNPLIKRADGKVQEIPLLSDMDSYEDKVKEVDDAIKSLNEEYDSAIDNIVTQTKSNAESASDSALKAETYKANAKTYMDNANAYAKEAKTAASSITGALKPKGTTAFKDLPNLSTTDTGAMYNISDEFISTESFKDGGNITYPAGTNIYKTEDGMWDCLAGQLGDYLMKDDIDTAVEESMPDYTTSAQLTELVAGEKMSTTLGKLKTAVKNVIALIKLLGSTDISKIGDGSVTGAISAQATSISELNSNIEEITNTAIWRRISLFNAQNKSVTLTFTGKAHTRSVSVLLFLASQSIVKPPVCVAFAGSGYAVQDISNSVPYVSDTTLGITASAGKLVIPPITGLYGIYSVWTCEDIRVTIS